MSCATGMKASAGDNWPMTEAETWRSSPTPWDRQAVRPRLLRKGVWGVLHTPGGTSLIAITVTGTAPGHQSVQPARLYTATWAQATCGIYCTGELRTW